MCQEKHLLEILLLSPCFLSAKSGHKDSKTNLHIAKKDLSDDEIILFFDIDDKTAHNCNLNDENKHRNKIRNLFWGKEENHGLCDFLVFYAKGSDVRVFCFVELKDDKSKLSDATEQVISTYDAFKDTLPDEFKRAYKAKAFVCFSKGSLPQEEKACSDKLSKKFSDYEQDGKSENFLDFLRRENSKYQKKGKKTGK